MQANRRYVQYRIQLIPYHCGVQCGFAIFDIHRGNTLMSDNILTVTDDSFDADVLGSDLPVLVDFWAEWCGPCKMIAPVLEEIAEEYAGKLKIAKLNIDQNEATAPKFGIRSIPTLILFKNGAAEATKIGAMSKSELVAFIEQAI
ncbi:MAG: thioredoxin 1 [Gammaproteobacteria bacterium]|jgi:thioredoxin 1|tara:strand:+ start:100 stop:534 length:435 start_codon:yes stop_codon:yes gene_type:complete